MNITDGLFITCCILSVLIIITLTIFASVEYKKESAIKNPYYWCDGDWTCCGYGNDNCDASKSKVMDPKTDPVYFPADRVKEGSAYHQNCILPIKNAILNYDNNQDFNFGYIYSSTGNTGANNPSVYAPGCTGPGGTGICADPKVNPQSAIGTYSCGYASFDSPPGGNIGNAYDPTSNTLNTGHSGYNGATFNQNSWVSNPATPYIAGITNTNTTPGNSFNFPYSNVSGSFKGQYTGGPNGGTNGTFTGGNTYVNSFYDLGPGGNVY
jgi:hypothetical protein